MTVLTAAAVLALAAQYSDWDPQWVVWQVFDAGTGNGESSGKTDAFNPQGPWRGLMQIADFNAVRLGYTPEQMFDARLNIEVAHKLWLERGTQPWPSAVKYRPTEVRAMTDGICSFAEQLVGREKLIGWSAGNVDRVGFCDHTAGGFYSTMQRWSFWNDPNGNGVTDDAVSVHFAIARDGRILQVLGIFDTAFAQGRLGPKVSWPPFNAMGQGNPNGYLISTEHEDVVMGEGRTVFIPGSEWSQAEYDADLRVKRWCVEEVRRVTGKDLLRFGIDSLSGHHMFDAVNRPECPGRFWRNEYRQRLYKDLTNAAPQPSQEETMTRFNAVATRLQQAQAPQTVQLSDFDQQLPPCKRLTVEVYLNSGRVILQDSDGRYAGRVGWDGSRYGVIEVDVSGGSFTINGDPQAEFAQVGVVGFA